MVTAIVEALAGVIGWFAAKGLDALIGKWVAYVVIAFEQKASEKSKLAFTDAINEIKKNAPEKAKAWDEWRNRTAKN